MSFRGGRTVGLGSSRAKIGFCATSGFIGGVLARLHCACIMLALVVWESILVCEISSLE